MKYIVVNGGVISGVGKGIIASSTGLLLKSVGLKVTAIKIDPYLNVDAGTMNPLEHGECFVLSDGGEVDLDMGNYERYLNVTFTRGHNITTGQIYKEVIDKERRGDFLGKTVQIVPHITDAIQERIERVARIPVDNSGQEPDVCIIELGGTVGDIESMPFVEALTQLRHKYGRSGFFSIHVSFVPAIHGEQKTKPTQHSVKTVRSAGLIPDLLCSRCNKDLEQSTVNKIAQMCQLEPEQVLVVYDMPSIYQVPMLLDKQGLVTQLKASLGLDSIPRDPARLQHGSEMWKVWKDTVGAMDSEGKVTIALVGKYTELHDSYLSVIKALEHSSMKCRRKLDLQWVDSEHLEPKTDKKEFDAAWEKVKSADGILVPGGFGNRGTEGMIAAAKWAREQSKPYLGVCLGMQLAVVEIARSMCKLEGATSEEFNGLAEHKVIIFMPEIDKTTMGGTMRLGLHDTHFQPGSEGSKIRALYGNGPVASERHRHRYEVNPQYIDQLEKEAGLQFLGKDDKGERMEIVELKGHPYFVGVQYHPEYLSRVLDPSKPFLGLVAAASGCLEKVTADVLADYKNGVNGVNGNGTHI
ncbi:hypothetical protein PpBr36_02456 [Pyricularia pennisetigena]|uniref:hypothetical protein n=1 Tax=Pyricularia pennisetigena TaxID=1578925 RepID=UPI00115163D0|nr:hypothetical protein PpBr36_02456 [Pyricularia pennisetigena]TLS31314.1 hypothetical protein PpBr36_02456 [Pyricularia pennisetigena]